MLAARAQLVGRGRTVGVHEEEGARLHLGERPRLDVELEGARAAQPRANQPSGGRAHAREGTCGGAVGKGGEIGVGCAALGLAGWRRALRR